MSYFKVTKYNDSLYQINDALGVLTTLVIGAKYAFVFDTGYGIGNLKEEIKKITTLPLIVLNSHGHMDHASGNYLFDEVYINKADYELCMRHNASFMKQRNIDNAKRMNVLPEGFEIDTYINSGYGNLKFINIGDKFDLGGIVLEVVDMKGHTAGSIGIYIKDWKLLLASDACCPWVWLFLPESLPVSTYITSIENTLKLDFDNFLVGHGARMFPRSKMIDFLNIAKDIKVEDSVRVSFGWHEDCESFVYTHGKMYDQDDCGVVYDPKKL